MKILHKLLVLSSCLAVLSSCGDFLNNQPKGVTIPSQVEDYRKLLGNSNLMINTLCEEMEYLSDNLKLLNSDHKATRYVYVNKGAKLQSLYSFQPGDFNPDGTSDANWDKAYSRIYTWNSVINQVMKSNGDERLKIAVRAEALFGRAYDYFLLVNTYGKHYNKATASTDYGVPLILEDDINFKITKRESVQEVYDQIFSDLKEAESGLPEQEYYKFHPDKCALDAFYAKIYLFMGEYAKALEYANKVLAVNSNLLDLNDYMMQNGTTFDRVVLKTDKSKRFPDVFHPEALYVRWASGTLQGAVMLSESLRSVFKKDIPQDKLNSDLRKYYFASENEVTLGTRPTQFPGECAYVFYINVNTGLSTVETKLIAAECEARVGEYTRALTHLNDIRAKRFDKTVSTGEYYLTAAGKKEALIKVLDERRREMMMSGHRLFDIKRLNQDPETAITYTHSADGETWTMPANSNLLIFPINNVVMGFTPDLPQYDRK